MAFIFKEQLIAFVQHTSGILIGKYVTLEREPHALGSLFYVSNVSLL